MNQIRLERIFPVPVVFFVKYDTTELRRRHIWSYYTLCNTSETGISCFSRTVFAQKYDQNEISLLSVVFFSRRDTTKTAFSLFQSYFLSEVIRLDRHFAFPVVSCLRPVSCALRPASCAPLPVPCFLRPASCIPLPVPCFLRLITHPHLALSLYISASLLHGVLKQARTAVIFAPEKLPNR